MLELDARAVRRERPELHLALGHERGIDLERGVELPRERETMRWIPREHAAPFTFTAVLAALVPAAVHLRLDDRLDERGLADVVALRPPRAPLSCEHLERLRLWRVDLDRAPHRRGLDRPVRARESRAVRHGESLLKM